MTAEKRPTSRAKRRSSNAAPRPVGRRAQNKQAISKRIVEAALNLFQTKGFEAMTTKAGHPLQLVRIMEGWVDNVIAS